MIETTGEEWEVAGPLGVVYIGLVGLLIVRGAGDGRARGRESGSCIACGCADVAVDAGEVERGGSPSQMRVGERALGLPR